MKLFENAISIQYTPEENKLVDLPILQLEELSIRLYAEMQEIKYSEKHFSGSASVVTNEIRLYEQEKEKLLDYFRIRIKRVNREIHDRKEIYNRKNTSILTFFKRVAREMLDEELYTNIWDEAKRRHNDTKEHDKQRKEFI